MKKIFALALATLMMFTVLVGCSTAEEEEVALTPEERTELYATAIDGARTEDEVTYIPLITNGEDEMAEMILPMMGLTEDDMVAYALGVSPMNMRAYGVIAIMPAEGKEETVSTAIESFVTMQQANFEFYLADQYDIALAAKTETLADGTILMVMCENQDDMFTAIKTAIEAA